METIPATTYSGLPPPAAARAAEDALRDLR